MTPLIFSISLLVAFSAAGLVWYGWGIVENVWTIIQNRRPQKETTESDDGEEAENPE